VALDRGDPACEGASPCRQSPPQLKQQTASTIGSVGICSTAAIPVKTKTSTNRLGTDALCSPRLGNASRTSTTPSRPPFPRGSRRSSGNSKFRNRKETYRFTKGALQRRSSSSRAHVRLDAVPTVTFAVCVCAPTIRSGAIVGVKSRGRSD
jgi:hypothetical protein